MVGGMAAPGREQYLGLLAAERERIRTHYHDWATHV